MKTQEQWNESGLNFDDFITPGDEVDSDIFWYFLEILPPCKQMSYGFLVGEPYSHDPKTGEGLYLSFYERPGDKFYCGGNKTVKQFMENN